MNISELCSSLIKIRSENPPGSTVEIIDYIKNFLDTLGIKSEIVKGDEKKVNLVSFASVNPLLICGHVDVVPARNEGWTYDPYSGIEINGYLWGRGSSDMKGGIASILFALQSLMDQGIEPSINLLFVCDEETGGEYGIQHVLSKKLVKPCDCLVAEPTPPLNPNIGQKGLCRVDISFQGIPAHGSLHPMIGRSAVVEACKFISFLKQLNSQEFKEKGEFGNFVERSASILEKIFSIKDANKILKTVTFNPGIIEGGEKVNVVAQHCNLQLDMRIPWGYSAQELISEISHHATHASIKVCDLSNPNYTPLNATIVKVLSSEIEKIYLMQPEPIVQWAASDAKYLRAIGCDVVEYGPGDVTTLHAIDEKVKIDNLVMTSKVYEGLINTYTMI